MINLLIVAFVLLIFSIIVRMSYMDSFVETRTTIVNETEYVIQGNLTVQYDNSQPYVIDPADQKKIWINSGDDMYEDAKGLIWRLKY